MQSKNKSWIVTEKILEDSECVHYMCYGLESACVDFDVVDAMKLTVAMRKRWDIFHSYNLPYSAIYYCSPTAVAFTREWNGKTQYVIVRCVPVNEI